MARPPNIVFVFGDEWRAQAFSHAGDANMRTPTIDRLAGESLALTGAVAGCPVCCPYRGSLLTGQYPLTHGVIVNDAPLAPDAISLARVLGAAGYCSAWIGKWHVYGSPETGRERRGAHVPRSHQMGFDLWMGAECSHDYWHSHYYVNGDGTRRQWEGYDAFAQTTAACAWLSEPARRREPFFLALSWGPPHFPLQTAPEAYRARFSPAGMQLRPNVPAAFQEAARLDLAGLASHGAALDDCMGQLLRTLEDTGLAEDTILIFTSDHGSQHHSQGINFKSVPFDESVRVPFLVRWPKRFGRNGRALPIPIDAPDILPTLCGLVGVVPPGAVEGRDWSAEMLEVREVGAEEAALLTMAVPFNALRWHGFEAYRGLRTSRYTYVATREGPFLLFDNITDPYQMRNLVGQAAHAALRERLHGQLLRRLDASGDRFEDSATVLARWGLGHLPEVNQPLRRLWRDPWGPGGEIPEGAWTFRSG